MHVVPEFRADLRVYEQLAALNVRDPCLEYGTVPGPGWIPDIKCPYARRLAKGH